MAIPVIPPAATPASTPARSLSFTRLATIILSAIGFYGLAIGLSNLLNGAHVLAVLLAFCIQGLTVVSIHGFKRARQQGHPFLAFRGGKALALYVLLIALIIVNSYSWWYRMLRADQAAAEVFTAQKDQILTKLARVESRYAALSQGFQDLASSATARADEERARGNTCRIASPKGPGPIQQFRTRDSQQFKDYAQQVAGTVREIKVRTDAVRTSALGRQEQVRRTEQALSQLAEQINAGLIQNPLLPGVVQFIDASLASANAIDYFGRRVKCEDEQRESQLIALRAAALSISSEPPLVSAKLLDPDSTYDTTLVAANKLAALVEAYLPFSGKQLSDLDPSVKQARLPNGGKVYVAPDYWPLLIAAMIEGMLFFVVSVGATDKERHAFINALMRFDLPLSSRALVWLGWLLISDPEKPSEEDPATPEYKCLDLPTKFVRLRPYMHTHFGKCFLVIPHLSEASLIHDYADALVLKGHAKTLVEESLVVDGLPSEVWKQRIRERFFRKAGLTLTGGDQIRVRVLVVSREFFAWVVGKVVEIDDGELIPDLSRRDTDAA